MIPGKINMKTISNPLPTTQNHFHFTSVRFDSIQFNSISTAQTKGREGKGRQGNQPRQRRLLLSHPLSSPIPQPSKPHHPSLFEKRRIIKPLHAKPNSQRSETPLSTLNPNHKESRALLSFRRPPCHCIPPSRENLKIQRAESRKQKG